MSSGTEPIPLDLSLPPDSDPNIDHTRMLREAFRQGWLSARHWPNHPMPSHLFISLDTDDQNNYLLRIEWP